MAGAPRSLGARMVALLTALALAGAPVVAEAKPKPAGSADVEAGDLAKKAEGLLDKLEYERAREVLESAVRSPAMKSASPTAKARLWALLGRARAELGDVVAMDDAFLHAVMFDRHVRLAKGTSPKILEALERARANAPAPGELADPSQQGGSEAVASADRPKPAEKPSVAKKAEPVAKKTEPERKPEPEKKAEPKVEEKKTEPAATKAELKSEEKKAEPAATKAEPKSEEKKAEPATTKADPEKKATSEEAKAAKPKTEKPKAERPIIDPKAIARPTGPWLGYHVRGEVRAGRTITLVVEPQNLPKSAKLELQLRRAQTAPYKVETLTRTGTVATKKLTMDRPRIELFVRAIADKKVIAELGTADDPIVLSTLPPPPSIVEAWSTPDHRPNLVGTSSTATASTARAKIDLHPTKTSTKAAAVAVVPPTKVNPSNDDDDTFLWLGITGGVVLVAGLAVLIGVVLSSKKNPCEAPAGFGCTEITVVPLTTF